MTTYFRKLGALNEAPQLRYSYHLSSRSQKNLCQNAYLLKIRKGEIEQPIDLNDIHLKAHVVQSISERLFGIEAPRFVVLEVPLNLLSLDQKQDIETLYMRSVKLKKNVLDELLQPLLVKHKEYFPGRNYIASAPYNKVEEICEQVPLVPLHGDSQNITILALAYYKDRALSGGEPVIGDFESYVLDSGKEPYLGIQPFDLWKYKEAYEVVEGKYTDIIELNDETVTIVLINNSINPQRGGILHGATPISGRGIRRLYRASIEDSVYKFDDNIAYVTPPYEAYIEQERKQYKDFFIARDGKYLSEIEMKSSISTP